MWVWSWNNGKARRRGMFLGSQHFGSRRACWNSGMGLGRWQATYSLTQIYTNQTTCWLVHNLNIFGARTNHGQLRTHKTTTAWTWGKTPPSPLYYTLHLSTWATSKWVFVLGLPSESPEISTIKIPMTLGAHNFVWKPLIAMRSETKL
jgi:hypothetical protein